MNITVNITEPVKRVQEFREYDLGQITTTLQDLLDSSSIIVDSNIIPILKVLSIDNIIKFYLIKDLTENLYNTEDYITGQDLIENDLIPFISESQIIDLQNKLEDALITQQSTYMGNAVIGGTPSGSGARYWTATETGIYTNYGGVQINSNSFGIISVTNNNIWNVSQSVIVNNKIVNWTAISFASGDQVTYLGKDWTSNAATLSTDIPGTSSKWVERLSGYGDKIYSKSVNLLNPSLLQKGLIPTISGTWTGNGSASYYGYSFVAPLSDFYTFENVLTGGYVFYIFDASGVKIKDIPLNKASNIYLNKGEKFNLSFINNSASSKITCRKDTNLNINDIVSSEYDFRTETTLKNNYFNFIDATKLILNNYNASNGTTEPHASSNVTAATKISKGIFYRIGARLGNTFDLIFNADGSFSRSVNVGHQGIIEFVNNETYISMSFLNTENQIGLCNRNTYIAYGTFEPKPSAVFADLEIPLDASTTVLDCLVYPSTSQSVSLLGLPFDTSKRVFALNDVVRIRGKVKPITIYSSTLKFGYLTSSAGDSSESAVTNWDVQTLAVTVNNYTSFDFTFTITQAILNTLNAGAEIGLALSVWGLTDKSAWQVVCEELTLQNINKGFVVNKITNVHKIEHYYDRIPILLSGKLFVPTTLKNPSVLQDSFVDNRNLKGKRVLTIGDSITEGTNGRYVKWLQNISGGAVTNIGSSGAAISRMIALLTGWVEFDATGKYLGIDITKYDVVTIMAGTNGGDFTGNMSTAYTAYDVFDLPTTINSVTYTTPKDFFLAFFATGFCNQYSVLIQFIQYYNPNCKIYLITPPVNTTNMTLAENRMVQLKSIADYYNVEMINAYKNTGMNLINFLSKYSSDGIHLNALGNDIWGKYIGNKINQ